MEKFEFRKDTPFSVDQCTFITFKYGEVQNTSQVRRAFGTKFLPNNPRKVPKNVQFQRVIDRFQKTASPMSKVSKGNKATSSSPSPMSSWRRCCGVMRNGLFSTKPQTERMMLSGVQQRPEMLLPARRHMEPR